MPIKNIGAKNFLMPCVLCIIYIFSHTTKTIAIDMMSQRNIHTKIAGVLTIMMNQTAAKTCLIFSETNKPCIFLQK